METEDDCFCYTDMTHGHIGAGIKAFFPDIEPMPAVSVDTEYQMPVSVSAPVMLLCNKYVDAARDHAFGRRYITACILLLLLLLILNIITTL